MTTKSTSLATFSWLVVPSLALALTVDALAATPQDGVGHSSNRVSGRPVDLVHLARYTLGNNTIEREVLSLFLE